MAAMTNNRDELIRSFRWMGHGFTIIAACMTASFGWSLGGDDTMAKVLIAVGLALVTILVAKLLSVVDIEWRAGNTKVAGWFMLAWVIGVGVEYFSHIGFTVGHRTGDVQRASLQNATYAGNENIVRDLEAKVARLRGKHDWQKNVETPEAYEAKITGMKGDLIFKRSKGCTSATLDDSRSFCAKLATLQAEQAIAADRVIVALEIKDAEKELIAARKTSNTTAKGGSHVMSQTEMVAQITTGSLQPTAAAMHWANISVGAFISLVFSFAATLCNFVTTRLAWLSENWGGRPGNRTQPLHSDSLHATAVPPPVPAPGLPPRVEYRDRIVEVPAQPTPPTVIERARKMLVSEAGGLIPLRT